ncbi:MAG: NAD(P)H-binding protein [Anaerolineales bacterium]|nr:NAD(P)H-binding protein [Anaerolineales bacterium]
MGSCWSKGPFHASPRPRKGSQAGDISAEIVVGDLNDPASLAAANTGVDAVALLIPAFGGDPMGAPRLMRNAVEAARAAGVKLIAWNSSGPMIEERTGFPMYDLRLDMVEALRQVSPAIGFRRNATASPGWR